MHDLQITFFGDDQDTFKKAAACCGDILIFSDLIPSVVLVSWVMCQADVAKLYGVPEQKYLGMQYVKEDFVTPDLTSCI